MRRLHHFGWVVLGREQWTSGLSDKGYFLSKGAGAERVCESQGWHKSWDAAKQAFGSLADGGGSEELVVFDVRHRLILAVLSSHNLESGLINESGGSYWKSQTLIVGNSSSNSAFANFNHFDVAWVALPGARYEVPCKPGYLELKALRDPDGLHGRVLSKLLEYRDYFRQFPLR